MVTFPGEATWGGILIVVDQAGWWRPRAATDDGAESATRPDINRVRIDEGETTLVTTALLAAGALVAGPSGQGQRVTERPEIR